MLKVEIQDYQFVTIVINGNAYVILAQNSII